MDKDTAKILIVDDEQDIRQMLAGILADEGHRVSLAESAEVGLKLLMQVLPDVVLLDISLPDLNGIDVLQKIKALLPEVSVVMISGHATIETAVRCTKLGAVDLIEKPLGIEKILLSVENALRLRYLKTENQNLKKRLGHRYKLIGKSKDLEDIVQTIELIAPKTSTVLITGENGTGKENIARIIHEKSLRAKKPFVDINCAAIPEDLIESELFGSQKGAFTGSVASRKGKFELAHGGTLFLDEIGDMSLKTQSKVLRVLQEHKIERLGSNESIPVDVRIIAATNKNLEEAIKDGSFREDLFYRLNVIPLCIPPLRRRAEDIQPIAEHYLDLFCAENGPSRKVFSDEALRCLKSYSWPGNVRELKNVMERLSILVNSDVIEPKHLPHPISSQEERGQSLVEDQLLSMTSLKEARQEFERLYVQKKLLEFGGNISKTADMIGLERTHLHRKLRAWGNKSEET